MAWPRINLLGGLSTLVALLAAIPLLYVIDSSFQLSTERWLGLWSTRLPELLWNTLSLAVLVGAITLLAGVSAAWLIVRRRFPARNIALWLMILPLTIPTYVFAYIYTHLLDDEGWLGQGWHTLFGLASQVPDIYSLGGVTLILALSSFPYIFLLVHSALSQANPHLEEAARIHGANSMMIFWQITRPLLRPAIAAGLALVTLHVLSDFGAVSMLRYQTFTLSIYLQMTGRFDYNAAAGLSLVLILLALVFFIVERFFRKRQRYYASGHSRQRPAKQASSFEVLLIWGWLGLIALFAFLLPLAWMVSWSARAIATDALGPAFWGYALNSVILAICAATIAIIIALPVGLFHHRQRSLFSLSLFQSSSIGFVLPGPVIALGVLTFILAQLPVLYGGLAALIIALIIRFLPLAVQSQEASMQQLTPSIEQAGRVLGANALENLWYITLPMMRKGMISAWVLVFIDALKELPATLLLRPIGFDTLPVRIWIEASEEMLALSAPAALMLMLATLPALWIMMRGKP
jgi:iron(III) transport system permease protein